MTLIEKNAVVKRHFIFGGILLLSSLIYFETVLGLVRYALSSESYTHVIIIPFVSLFVVFTARKRIFCEISSAVGIGSIFLAVALAGFWVAHQPPPNQDVSLFLSANTLSLIAIWISAFLFTYGGRAARSAIFPLAFLLLMVPLPHSLLSHVIGLLQRGSAAIAFFGIKSLGIPVLRQGLFLTVPGVVIQVAEECSGIRSSMGLLITCLLASHYFLRTNWRKTVFVLLCLPLAIVKNGIRIATLTFLSLRVDPGFLHGNLHRDGGFVFFFMILAVMWPILLVLQKSESRHTATCPSSQETVERRYAQG
jgi:exosortase